MARGSGFGNPITSYQTLLNADEGDIIVYADAGVAFTGDPEPLFDLCRKEGGILLFAGHYEDLSAPGPSINRLWTKRDCFILMDADEEPYYSAQHFDASIMVFERNETSLSFVKEFLAYCRNPAIITDDPLTCGEPNLPEFIDHRHDQSVLSILATKKGLFPHRGPSQWGNHFKPAEQREDGEDCRKPYAETPWERSTYSTILDHHRTNTDSTLLFPTCALQENRERNRASLAEIPNWIDDEVYENAVYWYGLPRHVRSLIDADLGDCITHTEVLSAYADALSSPVKYLEIGISVGKNFFQIMRHLKGSELVAFDFEDINPVLRDTLGSAEEMLAQWPTPHDSMRKKPSSHVRYKDCINGNDIDYICADIWDEKAWQRLGGQRFNLILSDASHSPDALIHEWRMIMKYNILAQDKFVMIWDDLGGAMGDAFTEITQEARRHCGTSYTNTHYGLVHGWLGKNEHSHHIGIMAKSVKLPFPPA